MVAAAEASAISSHLRLTEALISGIGPSRWPNVTQRQCCGDRWRWPCDNYNSDNDVTQRDNDEATCGISVRFLRRRAESKAKKYCFWQL